MLKCSEEVLDGYNDIVKKAKLIINLAMKIGVKEWINCEQEYQHISNLLQEMKEKEVLYLNQYIEVNREVLQKI